jgi:hypothetical protein
MTQHPVPAKRTQQDPELVLRDKPKPKRPKPDGWQVRHDKEKLQP